MPCLTNRNYINVMFSWFLPNYRDNASRILSVVPPPRNEVGLPGKPGASRAVLEHDVCVRGVLLAEL